MSKRQTASDAMRRALLRAVGGPAWISLLIAVVAARSLAQESSAGSAADKPPPYKKLRYDEDYSYLADPSRRSDFWDPFKYVRLDDTGDNYLSFGGDLRWRFERSEHDRWNPSSTDSDGYALQRYLLHTDLHLGPSLRVFGQIESSAEDGRDGGPRPTDEDHLDLNQLFIDVRDPPTSSSGSELILRTGRQEMLYGSQRLISVRDSPNVRRSFDAVRVLTRTGATRFDVFYARPVDIEQGTFDDTSSSDEVLWGCYATCPAPLVRGGNVDLYYLGLRREGAEFVQGADDELRHSFGTRFFGKHDAWDFDTEGVLQVGKFGSGNVFAWTVATDVGYTFDHAIAKPRVGLRADVTSGDRDSNDSDLQTFNPLFPRGAYFGEVALLGPLNLTDVHPSFDAHLTSDVTLTFDWDVFWRTSVDDGIYGSSGAVLRSDDGDAHFIGHQPSVELEWRIDRHAKTHLAYSHFFAGEFLEDSGSSSDVDFIAVWFQFSV